MHALTHCTIYTGEAILKHHAVLIENEFIKDVVPQDFVPTDVPTTDLQGHDLTAGFVDLQLYGGKTGFLCAICPKNH